MLRHCVARPSQSAESSDASEWDEFSDCVNQPSTGSTNIAQGAQQLDGPLSEAVREIVFVCECKIISGVSLGAFVTTVGV